MSKRAGGTRGGRRVGLVVAIAAVFCLAIVSLAPANNLDRRTATSVAKDVARKECQQTQGCQDWFVRKLHRVSKHKALGKIIAQGAREGVGFQCKRQIVIKLDHDSGRIFYGTSKRRCFTF
jgi:hypothetical protein